MACTSADETQARLALRALWPSLELAAAGDRGGGGAEAGDEDDGGVHEVSALRRCVRAEVDAILRDSTARRLRRLERKVELLCGTAGTSGGDTAQAPTASSPTAKPTGGRAASCGASEPSVGVQTEATGERAASMRTLSRAFASALRGASERPPAKAFGPSGTQAGQADPPEKKEDLVRETTTMRMTLDSLGQSLGARERQLASLRQQLTKCEEIRRDRAVEAEAAAEGLRGLLANPTDLDKAQHDRLQRRQSRVQEIAGNLRKSRDQTKHYQGLAQQQRAFFLQSERVAVSGGQEAITRHPAGEVVLVPQPLAMDDEKPEVWDVGTAIANPYVCDSWPFEPNVLARRSPTEATMQPFAEETEEDLEEEKRRASMRNLRPGPSLHLPIPGRSDDEDDAYDDRYQGPSETSRSL